MISFSVMTNSWSLLYEELKMDEERIMNDDPLDKLAKDTYQRYTSAYNDGWTNEMINIEKEKQDNGELKFTLSKMENNNGHWKYSEDLTVKEIQDYISGTYNSHYTSQESKTQTLDLIESIGDAEPFCRSNAIKYLSRFGKKNGKSKLDILKAIHYCILLYHFSGLHTKPTDHYETF